jgi:hypothetical protein
VQAQLLYRLKRMKLAQEACEAALDISPDDAALLELNYEIGLRR